MLSVIQRSSLFLFTVPGLPGAETQNVAACVWPTCRKGAAGIKKTLLDFAL